MSELFSIPLPRPSADVRLFCLPHAGSGPQVFLPWAGRLPGAVELWLTTLPGRDQGIREPCRGMAGVVAEIAGRFPTDGRPFALFGHSLGALIAFELARFLRREQDVDPVHLFVSACRAPHLASAKPLLNQLPAVRLWGHLRRLGGTPPEVLASTKLKRLLLPALRADLRLYETYVYVPGEPARCPISAFGGLEDTAVNRRELEDWNLHTTKGFSLDLFPGDHFYFDRPDTPLLSAVCRKLVKCPAASTDSKQL